jgi:hypothetical protein
VSNAKKILEGCGGTSATGASRNWKSARVTFRHPRAGRTTVPKHIPIKPWYVRDFVELISKLEDPDHD